MDKTIGKSTQVKKTSLPFKLSYETELGIQTKFCQKFLPPDKMSIQINVVRAQLRSYVGKPSSAYGWSGGFSPGTPVFAHLR